MTERRRQLPRGRLATAAVLLVVCAAARGGEARTIPAAALPGAKVHLGDPEAPLLPVPEAGLQVPLRLPLGRLRVEVRLVYNGQGRQYRERGYAARLGGAGAAAPVDSLARGIPLVLRVVNRTPQSVLTVSPQPLTVAMQQEVRRLEARDLLRSDRAEETAPPGLEADDEAVFEDLQLEDPAGTVADVSASLRPFVGLASVRVEPLSGPLLIAGLRSDRVSYRPGMSGRLTVRLENLAEEETTCTLTAELQTGLRRREPLGERRLRVPGRGTAQAELPFAVGEELWGRGLAARIRYPGGGDAAAHAVSVVENPWMVALHGRGLPMSGSESWSPEETRREVESLAEWNASRYCNIYEAFAWAPCDYSEMTPEGDEPFYSGQTQYAKRPSALRLLHEVYNDRGIHCITYGKACAAGIAGLRYAQAHPERMNVYGIAGFAHEEISVDVLDRMREERYRHHGRHEDFWQMWISAWTHYGNHAATFAGCDEIAASARDFGWDGVRYDGAWKVHGDRQATARLLAATEAHIGEQVPGFVFGYNHSGAVDGSRAGMLADVEMAAMARGGGLIMSEYYRNLVRDMRVNIPYLQHMGDAVRRHGGYFLAMYDDQTPWNAALIFAAGARAMGSQRHYKFVTRYSAYILDPAMRRLARPGRILKPAASPAFLWDSFIYEKPVSETESLLILQLVNVTEDFRPGGPATPPTGVSPPQEEVAFRLDLPAGYAVREVFACGEPGTLAPMDADLRDGVLSIPEVKVWTLAVLTLDRTAGAPPLADHCAPPAERGAAGADAAGTANRELQLEADVDGEAAAAKDAPPAAREPVTPASLTALLAQGLPEDTAPGEAAYRGVDVAGRRADREAAWWKGPEEPLLLRRNGRLDVHYARGVFYHRNRLYEAFARLPGVVLTDSCLREGGRLAPLGPATPQRVRPFPERDGLAAHDVLVLDNLPAGAFAPAARRAVLDFVRGGGGVLLLGGWYALSKGDYEGSFLEEALPVTTRQHRFLRRLRPAAGRLKATPAYREVLSAPAPAFTDEFQVEWINHIRPRAGAKVLLTAGGRPVLVAGRVGRGRAVVWAGAHTGRPEAPWWQSSAWPETMAACLTWLGAGAEEVSPPDPAVGGKVEQTVATLKELQLLGPQALETSPAEALAYVAARGGKAEKRFVAGYLLKHPETVEPADQPELVDRLLPAVRDTEAWAEVAAPYLENPPLGYANLVAEIAATAVEGISFETIMGWKHLDEITRLRCLAACGDARALPYLERRSAELDEQEAEWARLLAAGAGHESVRNMYRTRLVRPFVAWALLACGKRDAATVRRFASACLELPYYRWRQDWILHNYRRWRRRGEQEGNIQILREAEARVRHSEKAIARMERALALTRPWFVPAAVGGTEEELAAVARALAAADCHKSLPLALRYLRRVPEAKVPALAALEEAELAPLRHFYASRLAE